jgi:hypothetical protein
MIYLIGGPVRVGKSRLAKMMLERRAISGISTDVLTSTIGKLWPETRLRGGVPDEEWEMNFYPFLKRFIAMVGVDYDDFVIEGAVISPPVTQRLSEHFGVRPVFVGNTAITLPDLKKYMGTNTWLNKVAKPDLVKIPERIAAKSRQIERACIKYDYPYVDLAGDYQSELEAAYRHLA